MVQEIEVENPAGIDERAGERDVLSAWSGVAGRMVVGDQDRHGPQHQRFSEDVCGAGADRSGAARDDVRRSDGPGPGIQREDNEFFGCLRAEAGRQVGECSLGGCQARPVGGCGLRDPAGGFRCRCKKGGPGRTYTADPAQSESIGPGQPREAAECVEHAAGEVEHAFATRSGAEEDREHFRVRQASWTVAAKPLTRTLVRAQIPDECRCPAGLFAHGRSLPRLPPTSERPMALLAAVA